MKHSPLSSRSSSARASHRHVLGIALIIIAVALLIYDFFSPPVGELSNFALIVFAKLIAIAGSLMNINFNVSHHDDDA